MVTDINGFYWWEILLSSTGQIRVQPTWGVTNDEIVIADYNNDGRDDIGVYRSGDWYVIYEDQTVFTATFGSPGDIPAPSDFDDDGFVDLVVYRPNTGDWHILHRTSGITRQQQWGLPGDIPVPGDYFADGKSDFGVWRPSNGTWYLLDSVSAQQQITQWGLPNDKPVVGDFNGDGQLDLTVWRPSNGTWYENFRNGITIAVQWGLVRRIKSPPTAGGELV